MICALVLTLLVSPRCAARRDSNIDEDGGLRQVSFGTTIGSDLDYYHNVLLTTMPYSQAMALLCLTEYQHVYL